MSYVTQKDIAKVLGVSVQTVSMALRGHPRVSQKVREEAARVAKELGYQADPSMAALINYRTQGRKKGHKWDCVALISDWKTPDAWLGFPPFQQLYDALKAESEARGITLESHWIGAYGENAKTVFRQLHARGVRGILLAPPSVGQEPHPIQNIPKSFRVVSFGPAKVYREYHVVRWDYYGNLLLIWDKLWERGARRIGFVYVHSFSWRTDNAWLGAYLASKRMVGFSPTDLLPMVCDGGHGDIHGFEEWYRKNRPDAIITAVRNVQSWCRELGYSIPVAHTSVINEGEMGIDLNSKQIGQSAIELLVMEMQKDLLQRVDLPFIVDIPGLWVGA